MAARVTASELLENNNKDLKKEIKSLKRTIKAQQDAYETLREKYNTLNLDHSILNNNTEYDIYLEISKLILTIFIGFFTSLLTNNIGNYYLRFIVVFFVLLYIGIFSYQYIKNKKV